MQSTAEKVVRAWTNNTNAHGCYENGNGELSGKAKRSPLPVDSYVRNLAGQGLPVGVYTTDPSTGTCRWICLDLDVHREQSLMAERRRRVVERGLEAILSTLRELSAEPIVERSSPTGSMHVWLYFAESVPSADAYAFAKRLAEHAGIEDVEAFPKQPQVNRPDGLGNWVRLPGRHHRFADYESQILLDNEYVPISDARALLKMAEPPHVPTEVLGLLPAAKIPAAPAEPIRSKSLSIEDRLRLYLDRLPHVGEGQRDNTILEAARAIAQFGLEDVGRMTQLLIDFDLRHCTPPQNKHDGYYEDKVRRALEWAHRTGAFGEKASPARPDLEREIQPAGRLTAPRSAAERGGVTLVDPGTIEIQNVEWLVPGVIPRGMLTMIAARPGAGKSTAAVSLCTRILQAGPHPFGEHANIERFDEGMRVLYVHPDERGVDVARRFLVAGASAEERSRGLRLLTNLPCNPVLTMQSAEEGGMPWLRDALGQWPADLVVIDTIGDLDALGNLQKPGPGKAAISELSAIAERSGAAFICLSHTRKGKGHDRREAPYGAGSTFGTYRATYMIRQRGPEQGRDDAEAPLEFGVWCGKSSHGP
ncbi:MAG: AAA family ATPase, partial [Myxococcota bacterium]